MSEHCAGIFKKKIPQELCAVQCSLRKLTERKTIETIREDVGIYSKLYNLVFKLINFGLCESKNDSFRKYLNYIEKEPNFRFIFKLINDIQSAETPVGFINIFKEYCEKNNFVPVNQLSNRYNTIDILQKQIITALKNFVIKNYFKIETKYNILQKKSSVSIDKDYLQKNWYNLMSDMLEKSNCIGLKIKLPCNETELISVSYNADTIVSLHRRLFPSVPLYQIQHKMSRGKHLEIFKRIFNLPKILRKSQLIKFHSLIVTNGITCSIILNKMYKGPPCNNDNCKKNKKK